MARIKLSIEGVEENIAFSFREVRGTYYISEGILYDIHGVRCEFTASRLSQLTVDAPLTLGEYERDLLKHFLFEGYEWIAKDKCGEIYVYPSKPHKDVLTWYPYIGCAYIPFKINCLFWDDLHPTHIGDLLKGGC